MTGQSSTPLFQNFQSPENPSIRIVEAGDGLVVAEFEARIDPTINDRVLALANALRAEPSAGIRDIVPTFRSVGVYFDPISVSVDHLRERLVNVWHNLTGAAPGEAAEFEIPVWYGGPFGPDLPDLARFANCSEDEVIELHTSRIYRVYMLGFMPGRAYLASVEPRIAMGRHATPRLRVPAGSVGIAGFQTGFSAAEHPNGWRLIGRTAVRQFDLSRAEPFLLNPGDRVRFVPVSETEYRASATPEP